MNSLLTAIMTKTAGSALSAAVGGRIYLDEAPEGTEFPYVVFFVVSAVPEKTFTEEYADSLIQFSLFSTSQSAAEITAMYADLKSLFDECSLTLSGSTLVWMKLANLATNPEEITTRAGTVGCKHWAADFEIKTSLN